MRVVAFIPDLLFGSQVQGSLQATGHDVDLFADPGALSEALLGTNARKGAAVFIVDLTAEPERGASVVERLRLESALESVRTLAFYSHVDIEARARAERAGFEMIVPRSRMAREAPQLVARLAGEEGG